MTQINSLSSLIATDKANHAPVENRTNDQDDHMRIHWLQHVPFEGLGSIRGWAEEYGCPAAGSRMYAGDALPPTSTFDLLVVMGGPMNVNDEMPHPWLNAEKRFITRTVVAGKMVLGICPGRADHRVTISFRDHFSIGQRSDWPLSV